MDVRKLRFGLVVLCTLAIVLSGCGSDGAEQAVEEQAQAATGAETSSSQPSPVPPTEAPTPTPDPMAEFDTRSTGDRLEYARWNRGSVRYMSWDSDTQLVVAAANGFFLYDMEDQSESTVSGDTQIYLTLEDGDYTIIDLATDETVAVLEDPEPMLLLRYAMSPDETRLVSFQDSSLFQWECASGKRLPDLAIERDIISISFSSDSNRLLAVSGPADSITLTVWDLTSGSVVWSDDSLVDFGKRYAFTNDGTRLVVSGLDIPYNGSVLTGSPKLYVVDLGTGTTRQLESLEFSMTIGIANPMQFLQDGNSLLVAEREEVAVLDVTTDQVTHLYNVGHSINAISANPSNTLLATTDDSTIEIWDMQTGELVSSFSGYTDDVDATDFSSDGTHVLSVIGGLLQIVDVEHSQLVFEQSLDRYDTCLFGSAGDLLLCSGEGKVELWDSTGDQVLWTQAGQLKFRSTDRTRLLLVEEIEEGDEETSTTYYVDASTGDILFEWDTTDECGLAAPPDLGLLAVAREDQAEQAQIWLYDLATGDNLATLDTGGACSVEMAFSPSGETLAAVADTPEVQLWNTTTLETMTSFRHGHATISLFGLATRHTGSPEFVTDDLLVTKGGDWGEDQVFSWAVPSGEKVGGFTTSNVFVAHAFSKDGSRLYVGQSGMISVLDPLTGEHIDAFVEHDSSVSDILLSPDRTMMLSGSSDGTVIFRRLEE